MDIILDDLKYITSAKIDWEKFRGKSVLISGCYGMLASYLVYELIYLNETISGFNVQILGLGRSIEKAKKRFGKYMERSYFHFIQSDTLTSLQELKADYFIHAASLASPQFYDQKPVEVIEPNVIGTYNLLKSAVNSKASSFLFYSSSEIYGTDTAREKLTETDLSITNPQNIRNCYATSKMCGEALCCAFSHEFGIRAEEIRLSHTYGPSMDIQNDKRVFSSFVKNAVNNEDIVLKSSGEATRSFCYISDATIAAFLVLLNGNGPYNISNVKQTCSIKELAEKIVKIKNNSIKLKFEINNDDKMRSKMINTSVFDIHKIESLGWKPLISIENGFKKTIEYFKSSKESDYPFVV